MKKIFLPLSILFVLSGCVDQSQNQSGLEEQNIQIVEEEQKNQNYVDIKYRDDDVDIADKKFEALDTSKSSFVRGAWYDDGNDYMVINLNGVYYHYCGMPDSTWLNFKKADSFGGHYKKYIKGNYDCRENYVPNY